MGCISNVKLCTFNCKNITRSADCVRQLCARADVVALQETWLLPHDVPFLAAIDGDFAYTGKSAVDTSAGVLVGRPYGGVALLWRKSLFASVSVVNCVSDRIVCIKIVQGDRPMLIFSVYMPTDSTDNLSEFTSCLSEVISVIESSEVESVFVLGDFNAHPGTRFSRELLSTCTDQSWSCVDTELLPPDSHTFTSSANGSLRWLDHCVVTKAARRLVNNASILYGVYMSDHIPLVIECNINLIKPKIIDPYIPCNKVVWGERDLEQINKYLDYCNSKLKQIDFPPELCKCADNMCHKTEHWLLIDKLYNNLICILKKGAEQTHASSVKKRHKGNYVVGWNQHVREAHRDARLCYQMWLLNNKPTCGSIYENMRTSRNLFKSKLKYCQNNQEKIKMDMLATCHKSKQFNKFWKLTNKLKHRSGVPVSVAGVSDPTGIAKAFQKHFNVNSRLCGYYEPSNRGAEVAVTGALPVRFSVKEVAKSIRNMMRGKSPGHDGLSVEHLKYAGVHLPRVLALIFNLCLSHSYLPDELTSTIVVPVIKNKTGDASDISNYRPISLATVCAKVLDSLLDKILAKHIELEDGQFGFRPNLSTDSAILCLKQTVQYYTDRKTPVIACFLDLSRAFDLVNYDLLWHKLTHDTTVPADVISLFRYWYSCQKNKIKWAGSYSDMFGLDCGVRQGGLSSPRLFNLYINKLIGRLSSTKIGCHVDGVCVNNISYADDMVLLSPSIGAMRRLLKICESYAVAHGLKYNTAKSEWMVFKSGTLTYEQLPELSLSGSPLGRVTRFKYLGHWVTDDLKDNVDIDRERRSLAVRCNMLARRFARCSRTVKTTLFKAFCQSFYTCCLWTKYTQRAYSDLRVQYNNAFRVLLGLPWRCSASGMFVEARVDGFAAVMRKRCASMMARLRSSSNGILNVFSDRWDSPLLRRWIGVQTH